ncbi:hypothetical protein [Nocardia sp. X0981]
MDRPGPRVRGPILSLLLVVSGRDSAVDELSGEGLGIVRERLRAGAS